MLNSRLIEALACPSCRDRSALEHEENALVCRRCWSSYKIVDGIPVMVVHGPLEEE